MGLHDSHWDFDSITSIIPDASSYGEIECENVALPISRGDGTCFVIVLLSPRRCLAYRRIVIQPEAVITQSMLFGRIIESVALADGQTSDVSVV